MEDEELADAVVARVPSIFTKGISQYRVLPNQFYIGACEFVRDWGVAGVCLEALGPMALCVIVDQLTLYPSKLRDPRAIIEACVKALAAVDKEDA